jgi:hypothetical protein
MEKDTTVIIETVNDEIAVNDRPASPEPSRLTTGDYAILQETNDTEGESWMFFIRVQGNEDALKHLQDQLEQVDWELLEDLSTFDLDLDHYVSAETAKQMTKVDLNAHSFHRKFDGKLENIDLGFGKKDKNKTKICKTFDLLGYSQIEDFIPDEDVDEEDMVDNNSVSDEYDSSEEDSPSCSSSSNEEDAPPRKETKLPPSLSGQDLPGWIKNKKKNQHRH